MEFSNSINHPTRKVLNTTDEHRTKEKLLEELASLRQEVQELRQERDELAVSEHDVRALYETVEQVKSIVVLTDTQGVIGYVNPTFTEVTGYSREEALGSRMSLVASGNTPSTIYQQLWNTISEGREWKGDFQNMRKNGSNYWERALIFPIRNLAGEVEHYIKVSEDITPQKEDEAQFSEGDKELRILYEAIETIPSIVVLTDIHGVIEYVNPKFVEVTGYRRDEAMGKNINMLSANEQDEEVYTELWEYVTQGQEWKGELLNRKKTGDNYWESASIFPLRSLDGEVEHFFKVAEDISERKGHERERVNIIVNTAHLVNTPLTIVIAQLEMIKLGLKELDPELLDRIYDKVTTVADLVKNKLITNIELLTKETSDGWTPVAKTHK